LTAATENPTRIVFPLIDGEPRMPTIFPEEFRAALLACTGQAGGRAILRANPARLLGIEPENPRAFDDVDTPEEYRLLLEQDEYTYYGKKCGR
jgi:molybdenum cofactor cytidylyltransferase